MDKKEINELRGRYEAGEHEFIPEVLHLFEETLEDLKRCLMIIRSVPKAILAEPCEGCNTARIGYHDINVCKHDVCDKCEECCTCASE